MSAESKKKAVPPGIQLDVARRLGDVDAVAAARVVSDSVYLAAFRSSVKDCSGLGILELLASPAGLKCTQYAMTAICSPTWKPTAQQELLAAAMGHFMQLLNLEVPAKVLPVMEKCKLQFEVAMAKEPELNLKEWPDKTRVLYIIEVRNCSVFKLGTFLVDYKRKRRTVMCRYRRRDEPPTLPDSVDVDWSMEKLTVRRVIVVPVLPKNPDFDIHKRLRKMAKDKNLILCGETEFHDRALLLAAEAEFEAISSGAAEVALSEAACPVAAVAARPVAALPVAAARPVAAVPVATSSSSSSSGGAVVVQVSEQKKRARGKVEAIKVDWGNSLSKKPREG